MNLNVTKTNLTIFRTLSNNDNFECHATRKYFKMNEEVTFFAHKKVNEKHAIKAFALNLISIASVITKTGGLGVAEGLMAIAQLTGQLGYVSFI